MTDAELRGLIRSACEELDRRRVAFDPARSCQTPHRTQILNIRVRAAASGLISPTATRTVSSRRCRRNVFGVRAGNRRRFAGRFKIGPASFQKPAYVIALT